MLKILWLCFFVDTVYNAITKSHNTINYYNRWLTLLKQ